jgi:hypothetical protein
MEKWTREDMERDYPYFRRFVYDKVREEFERMGDPLPETDEAWLAEIEQGLPLAAFIDEIVRPNDP